VNAAVRSRWLERKRIKLRGEARNWELRRRRLLILLVNGDLPPVEGKGAASALETLETEEESAYRRLLSSLGHGEAVTIDAAQPYLAASF
jgi:hypothetical protein